MNKLMIQKILVKTKYVYLKRFNRISSLIKNKKRIEYNKEFQSLGDFINNDKKITEKDIINESEITFPITEYNNINDNLDNIYNNNNNNNNNELFYIETYGCQMNTADSEIVRSILLKNNYKEVNSYEKADIIFLNTCAIRENAENKIWHRLNVLKSHKNKLKLQYKHTLKLKTDLNQIKQLPTVGILGCMAERLKNKLIESDKLVDIVAGPDAYRDLPNLLHIVRNQSHQEYYKNRKTAVNVQLSLDETYADLAPIRSDPNSHSAYVSIMRGCNNMCSYCIVPFTRGRERSRDIYSIIDEIKNLIDLNPNVKEIMLLGQNVNSYHDKKTVIQNNHSSIRSGGKYISAAGFNNMYKLRNDHGIRFADLLDQVADIDPNIRIRFTSPHPKDFPDSVLDVMKDKFNICKNIHIPAQSGSSTVLERMRRGYTRETYLSLIDNIRNKIPGISLSSDFISGFCEEREEEHFDTISLMKKVCFDHAFMYAYSLRAKTHAAYKLNDNVPSDIKLRRLQEVIDIYGKVISEKNKIEEENRLHIVLIEGESKRSLPNNKKLTGLTDTNKRVIIPYSNQLPPTIKSILPYIERDTFEYKDDNYNKFKTIPGLIEPKRGDYILVRIKEAGRHNLHGVAIARTTLTEAKELIPCSILGPRVHILNKLNIN